MTDSPIVITFSSEEAPTSQAKALPFGLTWTTIALISIIVLALGLRLINYDVFADGNTYYTAAVKNMLKSPSNFFYATADAGNVTVDKPPVALWIQAIFGGLFGVNGFTVTLPSIIAGVLSVALLYHLVKKGFGTSAGLISAFILAITPISIATDTTNNLDSMLIFTLLLATWGFIRATETGKWRPLLLGAVLIGVGFNIKMLQAYLIVPALYAFYFLGADVTWLRKIVQLAVATIILLMVSFSWATVVELIPADQRPYIGGSTTNSAFELAIGYNGLQRLLGMDIGSANSPVQALPPTNTTTPPTGNTTLPQGNFAPPQGMGGGGGAMFGGEVGNPSLTRLFTQPLSNELSWLLPFGILTIGLLGISTRIKLPLRRDHQLAVLWGGWLMTSVVFFSISEFFHAYYLATPAPALAALVGIGTITLWKMGKNHPLLATSLGIGMGSITLLLQIITANGYGVPMGAVLVIIIGLLIAGIGWAFMSIRQKRALPLGAFAVIMSALFIIPASWGLATATSDSHSMMLPSAYDGAVVQSNFQIPTGSIPSGTQLPTNIQIPANVMNNMGNFERQNSQALIEYLQANVGDEKYLIAVPSSQGASQIVLQTDIDVMFLGGFSGSDPIHTAESIEALVSAGDLRYVMSGGMMGIMGGAESDYMTWVTENCAVVEGLDLTPDMDEMMAQFGGSMGNLPMPPQGMGNFPAPPQGMQMPAGMELPAGMNFEDMMQQSLYDCSGYNQ
ncbi:MAG: glycosyltransferase family 39 protein [bacterium]|nr:glycosyltransferase family 39 protein [bacterium]